MKLRWGLLSRRVILAFVFVLATVIVAFEAQPASALQITSRSLTLQAGASDGGSKPSGNVNHLFAFTTATTANIGSIKFEYCTTASGTCTNNAATTGVSTSATLGAQTGATGFTHGANTANSTYITRTAASISASTPVTYRLDGVVNPSTTNTSFFVRITTYTSTDATTGATDDGVVAASTATQIVLTGTMPESLIFCTGATVSTTSSIPDCSTATAGAVSFNQLFSPTDTATATSQMAASTNASSGYAITVNGLTLAAGSPTISAMASRTTSTKGIGQFGLNLKLNTTATSTVAVGLEVAAASDGTTLKGQAIGDYAVVDEFKFVTGETVANSANGGSGGPTNAQIYTVSYIVNVPGRQAAGTYTTTLTYICTGTF
jgi:hypothetical protein